MQSKVVSLCQVLSHECGSIKKLNNSEHASAYETLSEETIDHDDPASDFQSVVEHSDGFPIPHGAVTNGNGDTTTTSRCTNFYTF